ncbi:MAG: transposase [Tatlockia sp.]|nr:transposase [Tatlockia sp.]
MKIQQISKSHSLHQLMHAISLLKDEQEALAFFTDLCTPAEIEAMRDRWEVVPLLRQGLPYRSINEQTGVSVTTVTRVARSLSLGAGGYNLIADRLEES